MNTLRLVIQWILGIGLTYAVQRWDRRRLTPAQRDRAWNEASWGCALYGFGQFSMLGWVWVTRREAVRWWRFSFSPATVRGLALPAGFVAAMAITLVIMAVDQLVAWIAGVPE